MEECAFGSGAYIEEIFVRWINIYETWTTRRTAVSAAGYSIKIAHIMYINAALSAMLHDVYSHNEQIYAWAMEGER